MKVSCIYDKGSSKFREDGFICKLPFYGVWDGTSAPYSPKFPMEMFGGNHSGGEFVNGIIKYSFETVNSGLDLSHAISMANALLFFELKECGYECECRTYKRPGATFAFMKTSLQTINIVQAGDCFALVVNKDGTFFITENQVHLHDMAMNRMIYETQCAIAREKNIPEGEIEKYRNFIRAEMRDRFYPILCDARDKDINNPQSERGYGLLNGQDNLFEMMTEYTFLTNEVDFVILFTDGMIPWDLLKDMDKTKIGESIINLYKKGNLKEILRSARDFENTNKTKSYTDFAEATAVAVEF